MSQIELKGKLVETIYEGGLKQIVPVTEIYVDGIWTHTYGMVDKMLLPTYPTKMMVAEQFAYLMSVIINLTKPVSAYRGNCDVGMDVLAHLVGISRYTIVPALKHLQAKGLIIYGNSMGRSAHYHIEIVSFNEKQEEVDNGMVAFITNIPYVSRSEQSVESFLQSVEKVNTIKSVEIINTIKSVEKSNSADQNGVGKINRLGIFGEISTDKSEISTDYQKSTYINTLIQEEQIPGTIPGNIPGILDQEEREKVEPLESIYFSSSNREITKQEVENMEDWKKQVISIFTLFTKRGFSEQDLKELSIAYHLSFPKMIIQAVRWVGRENTRELTSGGMHYLVEGWLRKGVFGLRTLVSVMASEYRNGVVQTE